MIFVYANSTSKPQERREMHGNFKCTQMQKFTKKKRNLLTRLFAFKSIFNYLF